ncbi:ATP-binding cassette domain-containing protein [Bailinhaonella thermotolerans]|uniref:ATP-binding cassette domain-containing protein n=1 Tax=Bailinhaonella thermotolerans TaxID=1070861 RepID=A0A3A4BP93_9ACTN|nr:ATP-binding cassette domain-containing protein [Bailinhaonella thermotolerans]
MVEATGLEKTYPVRRGEPVHAVRGVDLDVRAGEVFGLLGPNGAGKTTTVRMLATLTAPTAGSARVAGHDLLREPRRVRERIGYVSQAGGVDETVSGRENVVLAARLHGLSAREAARRAAELLEVFALTDVADRPARTLSGGQRRRFALAIGLAHRPELIFLDEPTTGLDPRNRAAFWQEIRGLRDGGTAVLLTTHYLDEADALADRLAIVDHGRVVAAGTPGELKRRVSGDVITLRVPAADAEPASRLLAAQPYVREVGGDGGGLRAYVGDGDSALPALLRAIEEGGLRVEAISLRRATLDDVFLRQTGRSLRDAA